MAPAPGSRPSTRRAHRNTPPNRRGATTSTSCPAHRISAAFPAPRGCGRCARAWPTSARTRSDTSTRRACPRRAPPSRTICDAPAAYRPTRSTSCSVRGRRRRSRCSGAWSRAVSCRWPWRTPDSGCTEWCCGTTVSSRWPFRSTTTASTSPRWRTAARRRCCPPRHTSRRPGWCSRPRGAPHWWNGRAPVTWSSRTTTTPNTAMTGHLSVHCRASRPTG